MPIPKPSAFIKPTLDTKFHIDYGWWERTEGEHALRIYLMSHILPEQRERLAQHQEEREVDFIDPNTGEVFRLNELQLAIQIAAESPGFINDQTSMVDNVFRVFLKNNNQPLTPVELADYIGQPPEKILRTLSGGKRIYKGIRPVT